MHRKGTMALAVAAALGLSHAATAQTQDELRTLREQVRQLDKRVTDAEQAAIQASSRPASESAMNPAVSVILNGIYSNLSQDPTAFRINGFTPTLGEVGPGVRGFSLGESELALAANIDHNFRGVGIFTLTPEDTVAVEEAYVHTLSLPSGLTLKAARALQRLSGPIEVLAVAGPAFSSRTQFEALVSGLPRPVKLINEAGGHISELMLEADVVVGSGGMSVYEIAALGTPGIVLAQNAREERRMREFARHGTVEYLGLGTEVEEDQLASAVESLLAEAARRREMSARGRALVDGLGASRAAEAVLERRKRRRDVPQGRGASR